MNKDELVGKKVILYPDNYIARNLLQLQDVLSFNIISIINELDMKKDKSGSFNSNIISTLEQCDLVLILESSPKTLLLPPWTEKYDCYLMILNAATERGIPVASPYFELSIPCDTNCRRSISVNKINHSILDVIEDNQMVVNEQPSIMVTATRKEINIHSMDLKIKKALEKYHLPSFIMSSNPVSSLLPFDTSKNLKEEYAYTSPIIIFDGPAQGFPFQTDSNLVDSFKSWDFTEFFRLDGVLLAIHSKDSAEMVQETAEYLNSCGLKVFGLIEEKASSPWFQVYMEGKTGIPVTDLDSSEQQYKLTSIILNFLSDDIEIPNNKVLK
ncbi:hypothetical protein [Ruminiclostridium papyrosolvens]|uniref:Uncharacterized protein n=1 Tax=Ruminiclostridium papyrosolvens C7 TaxID=1330534 RepID=U4R1C1_9FIRM|nr:hypothetical protein [Ruminiclostridium papyrosolvens]EPR10573.1 hypothetical protein L323_13725 [Ruminiclostridium papyrosolvens C7]